MSKKNLKYSYNEKKAYYIGYGIGLVSDEAYSNAVDSRMGSGQKSELCNSAKKGFIAGKKNRHVPVFEKGYKKYPISRQDYLKK